jgi:aminomuconate-semialdehyde/2-hydroxymuconate-6-semialdehyde dehydrogenase
MDRLANFIGGEHRPPAGGRYLPIVEPATGATCGEVPDSGPADVDMAVAAAQQAFPLWSGLPASDRSRVLLRLADLIERDLDALARAESTDTGKPIALSRSVDIPRSAANFRFFATAILHTEGQLHETDAPAASPGAGGQALNFTLRRPRGPAVLISPWNLPLYLLSWKVAPALATGNTAIAKPSEVTPRTASMLAELSREAGLPPGVLNIVHGAGPSAGAALVQHPQVPTISFTGSTAVGRWIATAAGDMLKRVSLELGGKNPFVVFADADLGQALDHAVRAAFSNQGQICLCGSRLIVEKSIFQDFAAALVRRARDLKLGDPLEPTTQQGALTSRAHLEKVDSYVRAARDLGGLVLIGGDPVPPDDLPQRCRRGFFYPPTVITNLDPSCRVEQEEIFGPVVTVQPFETEEQALALANGTCYGLAATLWTRDLSRAHRLASALEAGIVWVNCWMLRDLRTPFGGVKQSGVGREGGLEALRFFTEPKNVCVRV